MVWKLFLSTFVLIFLAELGDKTQLAAMAKAAGSKAPWSIFLGASVALVLSTFIAVMFGEVLQAYVPPRAIQASAGVLFLIFGAIFLHQAITGKVEGEEGEKVSAVEGGFLSKVALGMAAEFERAAAEDYRALAAQTDSPEAKELLLKLAAEEDGHLEDVTALSGKHGEVELVGEEPQEPAPMLAGVEAGISEAAKGILAKAAEHEEATAAFYSQLAKDASLAELRQAFAKLAGEEKEHAVRLRKFVSGQSVTDA